MASKYRWVFTGVLVGLLGCGDGSGPVAPEIALEFHVASWFQGDYVDIVLDGTRVYAGTATTQLSGVATSVYTSSPRGSHRVEVRVGEQLREADFEIVTPTYVIINRDPQNLELSITITRVRPLWQ